MAEKLGSVVYSIHLPFSDSVKGRDQGHSESNRASWVLPAALKMHFSQCNLISVFNFSFLFSAVCARNGKKIISKTKKNFSVMVYAYLLCKKKKQYMSTAVIKWAL